MSDPIAEKEVKRLARLPSNTVCPNCGRENAKFGFSTVCIKFHTFVCNDCKSSHQAISHRCKSLTMSSWCATEVFELKSRGNDMARKTWLANAPPIGQNGRPKPGDSLSVYKNFVVDVYERKRYYSDPADSSAAVEPIRAATTAAAVVTKKAASVKKTKTSSTVRRQAQAVHQTTTPAPAPAPPVVADLLSFGMDESSPPQSNATPSITHFTTTTTPDVFAVNNDILSPISTTSTTTITNSNSKPVFDPFATSANHIDTSIGATMNGTNSTLESTKMPVMNIPKPVMNNNGNISAFSPQQQQQQMLLMQQQMFLMQQQQQQQQSQGGAAMMNFMMAQQQQQPSNPTMWNMMQQQQPMTRMTTNNSITNNFDPNSKHTYGYSSSQKNDPFSGLGF